MYWVGKLKPLPNEETIAVWGERSENVEAPLRSEVPLTLYV